MYQPKETQDVCASVTMTFCFVLLMDLNAETWTILPLIINSFREKGKYIVVLYSRSRLYE